MATRPAVAYVGSSPTSAVARPIVAIVIKNVYLRPTRSPMWPNTIAPSGRTPKPGAERREAREQLRRFVAAREEQLRRKRSRGCRTDRSRTTRTACRSTPRRSRDAASRGRSRWLATTAAATCVSNDHARSKSYPAVAAAASARPTRDAARGLDRARRRAASSDPPSRRDRRSNRTNAPRRRRSRTSNCRRAPRLACACARTKSARTARRSPVQTGNRSSPSNG